jgi:hypothetical protein
VDEVAAMIGREISITLEHDHVDAGAREEMTEHEPRRPSADDAAARIDAFHARPHPTLVPVAFGHIRRDRRVIEQPRCGVWLLRHVAF